MVRFLALAGLVLLGGCGLARQAELAKNLEVAKAQSAAAVETCKTLPTFSARARCINEAEAPLRQFSANPDLFNVRAASRVSLAEKVDSKQMTTADAELEFAKLGAHLTSEEHTRSNSSTAARASMIAAEAAARPPSVTCNRFGNTVSCF